MTDPKYAMNTVNGLFYWAKAYTNFVQELETEQLDFLQDYFKMTKEQMN